MTIKFDWPDNVPDTEFNQQFIQGMLDRMAMSYAKYGALKDAYPHKVNALSSLAIRRERYAKTANTEYLMDMANFAMIEFQHPRLEGAHYAPTDSVSSPGRIWDTAPTPVQDANTHAVQARRGGLYTREGD